MKIKPRTYYKMYYLTKTIGYKIFYTDNKYVYYIAVSYNNITRKFYKKRKWLEIAYWQKTIDESDNKPIEMSKEDLFLELL